MSDPCTAVWWLWAHVNRATPDQRWSRGGLLTRPPSLRELRVLRAAHASGRDGWPRGRAHVSGERGHCSAQAGSVSSPRCGSCDAAARDGTPWRCTACGSPLELDLPTADPATFVDERSSGVWRYRGWLPTVDPVSLGEPRTALVDIQVAG